MKGKDDDAVLRLTDELITMNKISEKMAASILNQRGHITALECAVLAIAEQLVVSGHLDAAKAAQRLLDFGEMIDPPKMRETVKPQVNLLAARLDSLSGPTPPAKPRGRGPKLIVDND